MNLRQINELWNEYKEKYDLPKDVQISAVQYDAEKYVEGFFNILELLDGKYILHLNPRFHPETFTLGFDYANVYLAVRK